MDIQQGRRLFVGDLPRIEPQAAIDAEMQQLFSGFELAAVSKAITTIALSTLHLAKKPKVQLHK